MKRHILLLIALLSLPFARLLASTFLPFLVDMR